MFGLSILFKLTKLKVVMVSQLYIRNLKSKILRSLPKCMQKEILQLVIIDLSLSKNRVKIWVGCLCLLLVFLNQFEVLNFRSKRVEDCFVKKAKVV